MINSAQIASLLRPGLKSVFGDYPSYPSQWSEIFDIETSDKEFEQTVEMRMLGPAQIRAEGSPTSMDSMGQRVITTYIHKWISLGFTITAQALEDNLYKSRFPLMARALKKSMAQTKEILAASIFNNGNLASFPIGDGQPFFSTSHPIDTGVVANTPAVQVDLNEASLEAATIAVQQFKDQAGLLIQTKAKKLLVPATLQYVAKRLLFSTYRVGTPNNDISGLNSMNSVPGGFITNQFLSLNNSWFLLTDAPEGLTHFVRKPIETDVMTEWSTDNLLCKAVERYSFGVSNFRCAYGSYGP